MAIKSADIGHGAKTLKLHKVFSRRIIEEFYNQGNLEKQNGLPVSQLCDKTKSVAQSQLGFLNHLVMPLY
jgi:3',5'-cyclic-nucleotide phosphodiesterase/cAMP-specific phosphodiesterase 4